MLEEAGRLSSKMTATSGRSNTGTTSRGLTRIRDNVIVAKAFQEVRNSWLQPCLQRRMNHKPPNVKCWGLW